MSNTTKHTTRFRRLGIVTIVAVYLLIVAGGIVRSTGSGMGCPDWPKCFGSWVPPTEVAQLPLRYKEDFAAKRKVKNERLSGYLDKLGFGRLAAKIRTGSTTEEAEFNSVKTWIEYVNRLLGAIVGVLIFLLLVQAFPFRKVDPPVFYWVLFTFALVGFQGWIGSVVVSTNLLPGMITLHMVLAIAIILLLLYVVRRASEWSMEENGPVVNKRALNQGLLLAMGLSFLQIILGTQVREAMDQVIGMLGESGRSLWIDHLGISFYIHRSFSLLVLGVHGFLIHQIRKNRQNRFFTRYANRLFTIVVIEVVSGIGMAYWSVPPFLQPIHLLLSTLLIGSQFSLLLYINQEVFFAKRTTSEEVKAYSSL